MTGRQHAIVTMISDLGTSEGHVAAIKGAVLSVCPWATIVDVTHHIARRDVTEAAFQLAMTSPVFPARTVNLVNVDSAAGTPYRPVVIEIGGQYFVVPDNGVVTLVASAVQPTMAVVLDRHEYFRANISWTFPGRDIFGPIAGAIATGDVMIVDLGTPIAIESLYRLPWSPVTDADSVVRAPIVSIDKFGNCRTLITRGDLPGEADHVQVRCGDVAVRGVRHTYGDVPRGKTLALFGSHGGLELAVRGGNAASSWDLTRGDEVVVTGGVDGS